MHTNETTDKTRAAQRLPTKQIASWPHLIGFLLIMAAICALGFLGQHAASKNPAAAPGQLASHSAAIRLYAMALLMDWALLYYCWIGVHKRGGNLQTLSRGRWNSLTEILKSTAIALPFWGIWEGVAYATHDLLDKIGSTQARTVDSLLPQSLPEIVLWIALSITAGFCEELAFRGYLMQQFHAAFKRLPAPAILAMLAQAVVFGIAHSYQGWRSTIVITTIGIVYGILALWQKNLRANILSHAWSDIWEGWLKQILFH